MSDDAVAPPARQSELRRRYVAIEARLDTGDAKDGDLRAQLKAEIIALYRTVDQEITELGALKEEIRRLVDKWKAAAASRWPRSRRNSTASGRCVHADHIGASTFIEKGWSRISLGDYEGAEAGAHEGARAFAQRPAVRVAAGVGADAAGQVRRRAAELPAVLMRQPPNALARINVGYICLKKRIFGEAIEHLSQGDPPRQRQEGDALRALLSRTRVSGARDVRGRRRRSFRRRSSWVPT